MQKEELPNLTQLASKMAANQAQVARYVDRLDGPLDELVAATLRHDWGQVQRISGQVAASGRANGYRAVSAMAQRVFDEAHRPNNDLGVKRSLIRLIGTCGRTAASGGTRS